MCEEIECIMINAYVKINIKITNKILCSKCNINYLLQIKRYKYVIQSLNTSTVHLFQLEYEAILTNTVLINNDMTLNNYYYYYY